MDSPIVESRLVVDASGNRPTVAKVIQCEATELEKSEKGIRFKRLDKVLPVLPPLPVDRLPREPCSVLKHSPYFLTVRGLSEGTYEILVEGATLGRASAEQLDAGVNLNEVYLRSGSKAAPKVP